MNIRPDDFVLEIGSGHNPKTRSDVLCDKFIDDDEERGGKLVVDRPIVEADGQYLPFAENAFDYVICSHVLEHVEDPELLISELMRVAQRGYIETPSEIGERIYGWQYHNWIVNLIDGRLVLQRNDKRAEFGLLFHTLAETDTHWRRFHILHHYLFLVQYEWDGKIEYEIVDEDQPPLPGTFLDLQCPETIVELLTSKNAKQNRNKLLLTLKSIVPRSFVAYIKSFLVKTRKQHTKTLNVKSLYDILVCPKCKGEVTFNEQNIHCIACKQRYPIVDGIPRFT
ncbi:methyltransferase domain-containing protein [Candidatus Poribacteria bacterium]|nr:methyltransferase domain-containing protein [Candidatus Poribacteria bacterium]MYI94305.1 methyltransferase domain-containing protein [Candidatus Poribacteria bacterium]